MKRYIIMSYDIHVVGGCQNYIYGKSDYLEEHGWKVFVLFAGVNSKRFAFKPLSRFGDGNIPELDWIPAALPRSIQKFAINKMVNIVSPGGNVYDETIIETHFDKVDLWGAVLARELGAKHVCFNCNELFRGPDKYYDRYLDYYWYKYDRKELYGITPEALNNLFNGYNNFNDIKTKIFQASSPAAVQNVDSVEVDVIPTSDWSICYIGRILKNYVDNVIKDVALFAAEHKEKKINFVIVGEISPKEQFIKGVFLETKNVNLVPLGNQVPIPRSLMRKVDVIIAGSGCAVAVVKENRPIIIPNPETCLSNGLFEYENSSPILLEEGRECESFKTSLERVLVEKVHTKMEKKFSYSIDDPSMHYDAHIEMIEHGKDVGEYDIDRILNNYIFKKVSLSDKLITCYEVFKRNLKNRI